MFKQKTTDLLTKVNELKDRLTEDGAENADTDQIFNDLQDLDESEDWFMEIEKAMEKSRLSTADEYHDLMLDKSQKASHMYGLHGSKHYWKLANRALASGLDFVSIKPFRSVTKTTYEAVVGVMDTLRTNLSREIVGVKA